MTLKRDPLAGGERYVDRLRRGVEAQKRERKDNRPRPMTYRIGDELVERINAAAEHYNVEKSGLVRTLLAYALDSLDTGQWTLPIGSEGRRKLEV